MAGRIGPSKCSGWPRLGRLVGFEPIWLMGRTGLLDRLERSDILNAAALAAIILTLGFGLVSMCGRLSDTLDEGLWTSTGGEEPDIELASNEPASLRPSNEVVVQVGNGSEGRQGLAGRATRRLESAGYDTLEARNKEGEPQDNSFVYYAEGFQIEASDIANLLNIDPNGVRRLVGEIGMPTEGIDVIVILGQNADLT